MADLERIAYDNALRALDKQERLLEALQARTGMLIAASSLAASLLGGRWLAANSTSTPILALALLAFTISLGASLHALQPSDDVVFALQPDIIYDGLYALRMESDEIHLRLAYELQAQWESNGRRVMTTRRAVQVATWSLGIEVLALILLLGSTLR